MADGRQFENRTYAVTRPRIVRSSPNFARRLGKIWARILILRSPANVIKIGKSGKCVLRGQDPEMNDCRESPLRKVIIVVHLLFYMQSLHNYAKHGVRHQCWLPVQFAYALPMGDTTKPFILPFSFMSTTGFKLRQLGGYNVQRRRQRRAFSCLLVVTTATGPATSVAAAAQHHRAKAAYVLPPTLLLLSSTTIV